MWRGVIEQLKDQHRCFALDQPGFGRSLAPADFNCSLENMSRFLDQFIEEVAIPTPLDLVVADCGATYGLSWAVTYPQKVRRIAIVGGSNFSSRYRWHGAARLLRIPLFGEVAMATVTFPSQEKMMRRIAPLVSPEYADQFGSAHVEPFPQNGHWLAVESSEIVAQRLTTFFA